ncbi:MAG: DUF6077 domain-containing protein [Eubacteriales bacterium]|nr:DUF6077 domain-containing protein [Eubacteriales bacterium]
MNLMIKGLLAVFWLAAVPWACGACFARKGQTLAAGERLMVGYCFVFALFEALTLPLILLDASLSALTWLFALSVLAAAILGLYLTWKRRGEGLSNEKKERGRFSLWMVLALLMILAQIFVVVYYAHMDADDSFYVGAATTAVETDTIFSINPFTGVPYRRVYTRYVLSPFPIFLAVVSRLCLELHPAILAHTVYPAIFLALGYVVLFQLGKKWFPGEGEKQWVFLLVSGWVIWFSGFSVYTAGNFQMVRIWQGKAFLAGVFLPFLLYLSLEVFQEERPAYSHVVVLLANGACCLLSSMGILLGPLLMGIVLLMGLFWRRSVKRFFLGGLCCLPSLFLGAVYLFIR